MKPDIRCRKCERRLHYVEPNIYLTHAGTDYWTKYGERRWKPTICMVCRSKVGAKAQRVQALQSNRQHRTEKD
jgi:hypothetical protein